MVSWMSGFQNWHGVMRIWHTGDFGSSEVAKHLAAYPERQSKGRPDIKALRQY